MARGGLFQRAVVTAEMVNFASRGLDAICTFLVDKVHVGLILDSAWFLPARRYASAGLCDSDVSVRLSVCLSHAGIVPSRAKAGS